MGQRLSFCCRCLERLAVTRLFISIIITVLGSLFFISWGLDKLVASQIEPEENAEVVLYQQLIEGFSQQLSSIKHAALLANTEQLAKQFSVNLTLEDANNIALPDSLTTQLVHQGGLLLASDQQAFVLRTIPSHPDSLLRLELPALPEEDNFRNMVLTAILYLGVCAILLLWLFPLARRLYVLTDSAAKIGKGELNVRVALNKFSYIHPLEKSFNQMAAQIEKLMADNKLLARSLSHDIRTPMSCLRFGVEAALDCHDIDKKDNYLQRIEAELTRMEEMTAAFLSYAGMERQGVHLKLEQVELNQFIRDFCQDFQSFAEQHHIQLSCQLLPNNCQVKLDCHWFYRALQNLVSNAIQYATEQVIISLKQQGHSLIIAIEDDGKGIAEDKLSVVFDPFVKLDVDRSREQGHFGLGLAICQKIIHWHKGTICAEQAKQLSGARFAITLHRD